MTKEKDNNKDKKNLKEKKDLIVKTILIIIIIILLLHDCCNMKKKESEPNGNINIIDITCDNNKCDTPTNDTLIDCEKDDNNSKCLVPNFVGMSKKDVLKWLSSISNNIEIEIKTKEDSSVADGTVLTQSVTGIKVKDLLTGKEKLIITIANNGSLIDCLKNEKSSKCLLPDFIGDTKEDVENWLNTITNNLKVKFYYVDSIKPAGTIVSQSIKSGKSIADIIKSDGTVVFYISKSKKTTPSIPDSGEDESGKESEGGGEEDQDGEVYVNDAKIKWNDNTQLDIFKDSLYKIDGKIAPESSNIYQFAVNNGTGYNIKYKITFTETNPHNINMKYKLKKNDSYIVDHYVSYNELNLDNILLNSKSSDTYYLEWKWVSSDNDTEIGIKARNQDVNYNLKIKVEAESV